MPSPVCVMAELELPEWAADWPWYGEGGSPQWIPQALMTRGQVKRHVADEECEFFTDIRVRTVWAKRDTDGWLYETTPNTEGALKFWRCEVKE